MIWLLYSAYCIHTKDDREGDRVRREDKGSVIRRVEPITFKRGDKKTHRDRGESTSNIGRQETKNAEWKRIWNKKHRRVRGMRVE